MLEPQNSGAITPEKDIYKSVQTAAGLELDGSRDQADNQLPKSYGYISLSIKNSI